MITQNKRGEWLHENKKTIDECGGDQFILGRSHSESVMRMKSNEHYSPAASYLEDPIQLSDIFKYSIVSYSVGHDLASDWGLIVLLGGERVRPLDCEGQEFLILELKRLCLWFHREIHQDSKSEVYV